MASKAKIAIFFLPIVEKELNLCTCYTADHCKLIINDNY